ncbi:MAG TPA: hypothetical protein VLI69_04565 [Gammaproteobacteria bacterium]|nr:hypothetical protein [Gammaproteobacteria bacterium]
MWPRQKEAAGKPYDNYDNHEDESLPWWKKAKNWIIETAEATSKASEALENYGKTSLILNENDDNYDYDLYDDDDNSTVPIDISKDKLELWIHEPIREIDYQAIVARINHNKMRRHLCFNQLVIDTSNKYVMTQRDMQFISRLLDQYPKITELNLSGAYLDSSALDELKRILKKNDRLTSLYVNPAWNFDSSHLEITVKINKELNELHQFVAESKDPSLTLKEAFFRIFNSRAKEKEEKEEVSFLERFSRNFNIDHNFSIDVNMNDKSFRDIVVYSIVQPKNAIASTLRQNIVETLLQLEIDLFSSARKQYPFNPGIRKLVKARLDIRKNALTQKINLLSSPIKELYQEKLMLINKLYSEEQLRQLDNLDKRISNHLHISSLSLSPEEVYLVARIREEIALMEGFPNAITIQKELNEALDKAIAECMKATPDSWNEELRLFLDRLFGEKPIPMTEVDFGNTGNDSEMEICREARLLAQHSFFLAPRSSSQTTMTQQAEMREKTSHNNQPNA